MPRSFSFCQEERRACLRSLLFYGGVGINGSIQRPTLNRRGSQIAGLKTCSKFIHDLRDRGARKLHGIDTDQMQKIVIEFGKAKLNLSITCS
jgi:hypothetical protein